MTKSLAGVIVAAFSIIMASSMVAYPLHVIEAVGTNSAHAHLNVNDNNNNAHANAGAVTNVGGSDGYHLNTGENCNSINGKCTQHENEKDRHGAFIESPSSPTLSTMFIAKLLDSCLDSYRNALSQSGLLASAVGRSYQT